ncbi:hypothetical protein MP228_006058 [Amoeboaphelidium protococcarum]|nr:hypothetical protein MP228_006058 [Amoeboaphelidium protococcarum]
MQRLAHSVSRVVNCAFGQPPASVTAIASPGVISKVSSHNNDFTGCEHKVIVFVSVLFQVALATPTKLKHLKKGHGGGDGDKSGGDCGDKQGGGDGDGHGKWKGKHKGKGYSHGK